MTDVPRGRASVSGLTIDWRTVGPFVENSYLITEPASGAAVLVDPGGEPDTLVEMVRESGARLEAIWLTHAHIDHIGGIAGMKRLWDVPVFLHPEDLPLYRAGADTARGYGVEFEQPPDPDQRLVPGDRLTVGGTRFLVRHTPGHAPGHVVFVGPDVIIGGDLLFAGSVGRTDLPYSDPDAMARSLSDILTLDDALPVYPGHGHATTIGAERASKPWLVGLAGGGRR